MSRRNSETERNDMLLDKCPAPTFADTDLNVAVPGKFTYPKRYWFMDPFEREITWLLDQDRIDDAVVYYINESRTASMFGIPFLKVAPSTGIQRPRNEVIDRLIAQGRIKHIRGTRFSFMLTPKSGIDRIQADVAFFSERPNPAYPGSQDASPEGRP